MVLDEYEKLEKPFHDWIDDYEHTGNYGEEVNSLDDTVKNLKDEVYDDIEDNVDVVR